MKKSLVLYFIVFCLCPVYRLSAQSNPDTSALREISLETLEVSAGKTTMPFSETSRSITVIQAREIAALPVRDLGSLLEHSLGIDIRQRGPLGQQADISIRGGSFDQLVILLNGVNISDPQTGHHNLDLPVDLSMVERIEVLRGPGARIFGPNAFNGAVNIITKDKNADFLNLGALGGQHGLFSMNAASFVQTPCFSALASVSAAGSDGYTENTDFNNLNIFLRGSLSGKKPLLEYQAGYTDKSFGANSFYTPRYPEQYEQTKTVFASLRLPLFANFTPSVYWRRHFDRFELFRNNAPAWYTSHNFHRTDVVGSSANRTFRHQGGFSTSIGYDLRHERIVSNKLGEPLESPIPVSHADSVVYSFGQSRTQASLFVEEIWRHSRISISAGLLGSYLSDFAGKLAVYPGLDFGYEISKPVRIYLSANRTLRLPTFTDLYYNDAANRGNPELKPEEANVLETGLKYNSVNLRAEVAAFHRSGIQMIDWVKYAGEERWQAMNLTKVRITGLEGQLAYRFAGNERRGPGLKSVQISYAYQVADKSSEDYLSKYVLDIMQHKADAEIVHSIFKNLRAAWTMSLQKRAGGYIAYHDGVADASETPYKPVWLVSGRINYAAGNWLFFADVTNLLNAGYVDFGNVIQPGRWVSVGGAFRVKSIPKQR